MKAGFSLVAVLKNKQHIFKVAIADQWRVENESARRH
jgi:hypothetical protein